ncbi:hypothetical protein PROFUN_12718 [Planoprotostelium fungivorum]|uniref:Haloacid dehalogenase n=1 Tax=Planoprotostelium fungivorum TaxID=1890364 RepID=A0A2P6N6G4_9EUKA|nr:hypothetical protein PROFUN_12718 [Planoprotostelium fungivorum]
MARLVVVHDVLGTLFSLEAAIDELKDIFSQQLSRAPPILPEIIIMDWYHATQRDYTNVSINGDYQPISKVFRATLPRILLQAGLAAPSQSSKMDESPPPQIAGAGTSAPSVDNPRGHAHPYGEEIVERMMSSLQKLKPRPGMIEAFQTVYHDETLHSNVISKVDLWGATNGSMDLTKQLFSSALPSFEITSDRSPSSNHCVSIFSCDQISTAKPHPRVYEELKRSIGVEGGDITLKDIWFVASHTWDTYAAKRAGFKTAWVTYEEFYDCGDVYGRPDVVAKDMEEAAKEILKYERVNRSTST